MIAIYPLFSCLWHFIIGCVVARSSFWWCAKSQRFDGVFEINLVFKSFGSSSSAVENVLGFSLRGLVVIF